MILGSVIVFRVYHQHISNSRKRYFIAFGALIIFSGALCFILEQNWFLHLEAHIKIPVYAILGISISYALTFAIVDLVNYICLHLERYGRSPVENSEQIIAVIILSAVMGAVLGIIFGLMDIEDEVKYHDKLSLMKEELYCYPIGGIIGFVSGGLNDYLQVQEIKHLDSFDDEI